MLHLLTLYSIPLPIIYNGEFSMQTKHCMLTLKGVGSFSVVLWLFCFRPGPLCCTGRNYAKYSEGIGANPVKILKVSAHVSSNVLFSQTSSTAIVIVASCCSGAGRSPERTNMHHRLLGNFFASGKSLLQHQVAGSRLPQRTAS